jgi:fucose 4-O-acetylase-like acetyltransferase
VFGLWFTVLYLIFRRHEVGIKRYLGWFLLPLGLLSLFTYVLHGFVIFVVALTIPETGSLQGNFATTAGCLLVIWAMTASVKVALQSARKAN